MATRHPVLSPRSPVFSAICAATLMAVSAMSSAGPAYRVLSTTNPQSDSWRDGLTINIRTDNQRCKNEYGSNWTAGCAAPAAGVDGQRVDGIVMSPAAEGTWRWDGSSSLTFRPKKTLAPGTTYKISLEAVELPARFNMARVVRYSTQPQAVNISRESLWIDPSSKNAHAISVPLSFIWPANRQQMQARIRLEPADKSSGLTLSKPTFVWNEARDQVVVSAKILSLPKEDSTVQVVVEGLPRFSWQNGRRVIQRQAAAQGQPKPAARTVSSMSVTGTDRLMNVKNISIQADYSKNLARDFVLEITTTQHVKAGDVLKSLDLRMLPERADAKAGQKTRWNRMPALSREDIERAKKLTGTLLQPAEELSTTTRISVPVEAGRGLLAIVKEGLKASSGLTLNRTLHYALDVPSPDPEINFLQPGNVLPLGADQTIDVHTLGLTSLRWRIDKVRDPFLALLAQTGSFTYNDEVNFDAMSTAKEGTVALSPEKGKPGAPVFTALQLSKLMGQDGARGLMRLTLQGFQGDKQQCSASRLILATDLGLMIKRGADGRLTAFVQKLSTGEPATAKVQVLGKNGLAVLEASADKSGRANLPSLFGLPREKAPAAVIASAGNDFAWLPLQDSSREVDYSGFAVSGLHATNQGLNASVYSQRGVYMPGETLHFGFLVRNQDWKKLPEKLPLEATLYSPAGARVLQKQISVDADGMGTIEWKSDAASPAGLYRLDLAFGSKDSGKSVIGSAVARVEEFQPDTLSLKADFGKNAPRGWIVQKPGEQASVTVHLDNLYGEPAAEHRVKASIAATPARLKFAAFPDYTFVDGSDTEGSMQTEELPDATTDAAGNVTIALPLEKLRQSTSSVAVMLEGFEAASGSAVSRTIQTLVSPRDIVLGYKPEDGANNLGYIAQNAKAGLRLIAVNNDLRPVELKGAKVTLSARRFVTSLVSDTRGNYRYESTPVDSTVASSSLDLAAAGTRWEIPTATPGDYLVTVRRPSGEILASIPFNIAGEQLATPGQELTLADGELRMKLEKDVYKAGDKINFRISTPFAGSGLVTIERDGVQAHAWFKAQPGESVQSIEIPKGFEGRGFVNVTFVRSVDSPSVYMKPFAYAVAPFTAAVDAHNMGLSVKAPETIKPGQTVKVTVNAKKPGRVQLFAVDEGVLQLTQYSAPDPIKDLLSNRALDVATMQAYDLLMPTHEKLRGRIPHFGGDMDTTGGRFLNPFRRKSEPPFSFWSEPVAVKGTQAEFSIPVPEYFSGKLRIMAVGTGTAESAAAGSAQATTTVRGGLILKPQLPLVSTPGDTFDAALVVANTVKGSGKDAKVSVTVDLPPGVELVGSEKTSTITVAENGEKAIIYKMRSKDVLGSADVRFTAKLAGAPEESRRTQSLSIRPAGAMRRTETALELAKAPAQAGAYAVSSKRTLYPAQAKTELAVAPAQLLALKSLFAKLDQYPYGCTEQNISRAMPYVVLWDAPVLRRQLGLQKPEAKFRQRAEEAVTRAVSAIRASIVPSGGVSLWPGVWFETSDFMTAYAADFLVTLREHGLSVPQDLADQVLGELERSVGRTPRNVREARVKAYGAWTLQRDGRIMTNVLNELEAWYRNNGARWKDDVSSALLADSFRQLRLTRKAADLLPQSVAPVSDTFFSTGMAAGLYSIIVAGGFPERNGSVPMNQLLDASFTEYATTIDMAFGARALAAHTDADLRGAEGITIACTSYAPGFGRDKISERTSGGGIEGFNVPGCRQFSVKAPKANGLWAHLAEQGFDRVPVANQQEGLEVTRTYLDTRGNAVGKMKLGDVVTVNICARSPGKTTENAVISDLVPGGLEPMLEKTGSGDAPEGLKRYERREDRALFFAQLVPEQRCFTYRARASTRGVFTLPAVQAEDMYDPARHAVKSGGKLEIR